MTAPAPTTRVKPTAKMLGEGFKSLITFEADPDVEILEIEVTSGGEDIGDPIPASTMHNVSRETQDAPALVATSDGSILCAYNPTSRAAIRALMGVHTTITHTYPDGSSIADFGWVRSFAEGSRTIKGRCTATIGFSYAGKDSAGNEEVEVYTAPV